MSYYLAYHKITNQLVYLSINAPTGLDESFTVEFHEETMPRLDLFEWNPTSLSFFKKHIRIVSNLDFLKLFTLPERINIRSTKVTDPILFDLCERLDMVDEIDMEDASIIQAIGYLKIIGILTEERHNQILQG